MDRLPAGMLAASLLLAGCASGGFSVTEGLSDATNSFASDHSLSYMCQRYDPATGNLTDMVSIQRSLNPNAASVAALAAGFQAVVGLAGAIAKPAPVPMGARATADAPPLTVAGCLGEHALGVAAPPPPNPAPPPEPFVAPAAPVPPDPLLEPHRWYAEPGGHVRYLEGVDRGTACWRSGQGAEHCSSVADWLAWARRPSPAS